MAVEYPKPEPRPATLLERLTSAGISESRAHTLIESGMIRLDGHEDGDIRDPSYDWPWPNRWCHAPSN